MKPRMCMCVQHGLTNVQTTALKISLFTWSPHASLLTCVRVAFNMAQWLIIINKCQQWQRKAPDEMTELWRSFPRLCTSIMSVLRAQASWERRYNDRWLVMTSPNTLPPQTLRSDSKGQNMSINRRLSRQTKDKMFVYNSASHHLPWLYSC